MSNPDVSADTVQKTPSKRESMAVIALNTISKCLSLNNGSRYGHEYVLRFVPNRNSWNRLKEVQSGSALDHPAVVNRYYEEEELRDFYRDPTPPNSISDNTEDEHFDEFDLDFMFFGELS
ncbi:MAG: hypothetical protein WCO09_00230 [bacterium]